MRRICLCLLIAFASAGATAREVRLLSADGGSCPEATSTKAAKQKIAPQRDPAPAREPRPRPSLHSDSDGVPGKARWHSFLPGMFR